MRPNDIKGKPTLSTRLPFNWRYGDACCQTTSRACRASEQAYSLSSHDIDVFIHVSELWLFFTGFSDFYMPLSERCCIIGWIMILKWLFWTGKMFTLQLSSLTFARRRLILDRDELQMSMLSSWLRDAPAAAAACCSSQTSSKCDAYSHRSTDFTASLLRCSDVE